MYIFQHRGLFQPLSLAMMFGCASFIAGCAGDTETKAKPAVVIEEPPKAVEKLPKPVPAGAPAFWQDVPDLRDYHQYENGLRWRLGPSGIQLESTVIEGNKVDRQIIQQVWDDYGDTMEQWSTHYGVPIEIVMTTVCVESKGNARATNAKNFGLMQILVPTARNALNDQSITEDSLYDPEIAIKAGTAYIALQANQTKYDPPKVAAAYNAGSLRSADNPWGMKQYGPHLDKTVMWFNEVLAFVAIKNEVPPVSFADYFRKHP
jgi:soluble lytic murein transglycosylase-like protein